MPRSSSSRIGRSAVEIAGDVRAGRVSAVTVAQEHLARIRDADQRVGAFQQLTEDLALADARAVDVRVAAAGGSADALADLLPLAGVPVAVKDSVPVAGYPMRVGSAVSPTVPQPADHEVVARLRAAGAVVVGLTRVPELCVWPFTDGPLGVARNPWDLTRTPGGSSGGSAAAVAAGLVPLALGNDGLGSIRIPSACCGLLGVKPGTGLVPAGLGHDSWSGMAVNGPLATTVADAALGLAVLAGVPGLARVQDPGSLRVAVSVRSPVPGVPVDPDWAAAAHRVAGVLRGLGHHVVDAAPPAPTWAALAALGRWFAGTADDAAALGVPLDRAQRRTRVHARLGAPARRLGRVRPSDTARWQARVADFFGRYDVLLTPGLAAPPPMAQPWADRGWAANVWAATRYTGGFQAPWNLAGWPAVAVPAGVHPIGTPVGVQLVCPPGQEARLLGVAGQLETASPWSRHAPGSL